MFVRTCIRTESLSPLGLDQNETKNQVIGRDSQVPDHDHTARSRFAEDEMNGIKYLFDRWALLGSTVMSRSEHETWLGI